MRPAMNSAGALIASTAWIVPSPARWKTAKDSADGSPRTAVSVVSNGRPAICRRTSVLIGPEPGHLGRGRRATAQIGGDLLRLFDRVGHTLEAAGAVVQRQRPMGAIADRANGGIRRACGQIDDDAVVAGKSGPARQCIVRGGADADQRDIARDAVAIGKTHRRDLAADASERFDRGVHYDVDTRSRMTTLEEVGQGDGGNARQDARLPLDHRDVGAEYARGCGDLQANIAGADDRNAHALAQQWPEAIGIAKRAQSNNAGEVVAWHVKWPRVAAGCEDQMVVGGMLAGRQLHRFVGAIDLGHFVCEPQIDAVGLIECGGAQQQVGEIALTLEPGLGERRALIRRNRFRTDQRDGSLPPILAQQRGGGPSGMAGAYDHCPGRCVAHAGSLGTVP